MYQYPPDPHEQPPHHTVQFQSAKRDGGAVVRQSSTYMTDPDAERFCEVFAEGLDSGLGYARILGFLDRKGLRANIVNRLREALLEEGCGLSEAFARYGLLDAPARKLVLVAEGQGMLPETLLEQAKIYRARYERKKKLIFGSIEAFVMALFAFAGLLPVIANLMKIFESRGNVFVEALKTMLGPMTFGMFALMTVLGAAYAWLNLPVDMALRETAQRMLLRIPVVSRPGRLFSYALFARYFYNSVRSGLNVQDSIYLAAESSNNPLIFRDIDRALDMIERGHSLEESLSTLRGLPDDLLDYIGMGEETGRLEEMLLKCMDVYEKRAEESFEHAMQATIYVLRIIMLIGIVILAFSGLLKRLKIFDKVMGTI